MNTQKIPHLVHHILVLAQTPGFVFSDVHIEIGEFVMARTPQGFVKTEWDRPVTDSDFKEFLDAFSPQAKSKNSKMQAAEESRQFGDVRLRCSVYSVLSRQRMCASVRVLSPEPPTLDETGLPNSVFRYASSTRGLLLVTGPTGSGKSTTCGAYLREINRTRSAHVVTVEDPPEYLFARDKAVFSQRHVGVDVGSFSQGLAEALRQRPDVILIGEIRDRDTAETALRASDSGHFVIGTMHARTAASAIGRFIQFFEPEPKFAARSLPRSLVGVISQCLVPSIDGSKWLLAAEVLHGGDPTLEKLIDEMNFKGIDDHIRLDRHRGGTYMNQVLANMVKNGQIAKEQALANSPYPLELLERLGLKV